MTLEREEGRGRKVERGGKRMDEEDERKRATGREQDFKSETLTHSSSANKFCL